MAFETAIRTAGISKSFGATRALADVDIELAAGEVHGLVGENGAGKSTLVNVMSGVLQPDAGRILLGGRTVTFRSPRQAQAAGIGLVHQELALCPDVSVAENIFMGRAAGRAGLIDFRGLYRRAEEVLRPFQADINPRHRTGRLTVAQQQVVEIAKALSMNCRILILDEPTSSLTDSEAAALFGIIRRLRARGISILYITHRIAEIFDICDRVTVLRDGHYIDTLTVRGARPEAIINRMVGRELANLYPRRDRRLGEVLLEVEHLSRKGAFEEISFRLREGEVLGFAGLVGAGRTELARCICRIDRADSGTVKLRGRCLRARSFRGCIDAGLAYLPEDRKAQGLFLKLSVRQNTTAAAIDSFSRFLFVDRTAEAATAGRFVDELRIALRSLSQPAGDLSGGNQQKLMVAKWLATRPRVILLDEPTRGIDVGAKTEIYALMEGLVRQGVGIVLISSDLPEIIGMCDRVIVMFEGSHRGTVGGEDVTEEKIMALAAGH